MTTNWLLTIFQFLRRHEQASYPAANAEVESDTEGVEQLLPFALSVCKEFVSGWDDITVSDIKLSVISGGLTNKLYRCSIPAELAERLTEKLNNASPDDAEAIEPVPRQVLLRMYGVGTETFFNRENEHKIFKTFSKNGLGPKLYGIFENGRVEEFLELHSLDHSDLPRLALSVAQQIVRSFSFFTFRCDTF
jgi:hypothetical protein